MLNILQIFYMAVYLLITSYHIEKISDIPFALSYNLLKADCMVWHPSATKMLSGPCQSCEQYCAIEKANQWTTDSDKICKAQWPGFNKEKQENQKLLEE